MGIFASESNLFRRYRARLQMRDRLVGGIPRDPKMIEGWLRSKIPGISDVEVEARVREIMDELGAANTFEGVTEAAGVLAASKQTTGFKRDPQHGLYIESRQIKAALKESANVVFKWKGSPKTQMEAYGVDKAAKNYVAERVFVSPDKILLGRMAPDDTDMFVGHVTGPQGPRSTLGYHEVVIGAELTFEVMEMRDSIPSWWWPNLWEHMQENGIGSLRSQGFGRFDIVEWTELETTPPNGKATGKALAAKR